jgi:Xaa-Pro aminopeptidase
MVVAVKPKVALPGLGVVGIEDTLVIGKQGAVQLTQCSSEFTII